MQKINFYKLATLIIKSSVCFYKEIKKSLLFQVGFPLMTFALIIQVYCCLKQRKDLTEILKNKKAYLLN
ncbi:hypothetical protein BI372_00705 [Acinetobacter pittii]|nr:hypothetical protein BI372_00705 [Acinetobacter pittii]